MLVGLASGRTYSSWRRWKGTEQLKRIKRGAIIVADLFEGQSVGGKPMPDVDRQLSLDFFGELWNVEAPYIHSF